MLSKSGFVMEKRGNIPVSHPDMFTVPLPLHMVDSNLDHKVGTELKMLYVGGERGAQPDDLEI